MVYTGIHIEWLNMVDNVQSSDHGGFTIRNGEDHRQTWGFEFEPINNGHQLSEFKARMTGLFIQPVCRGFYWKPTIMTGGHYHCKSPHVFVDETGTFDHGVGTWCFFIWGVWKWSISHPKWQSLLKMRRNHAISGWCFQPIWTVDDNQSCTRPQSVVLWPLHYHP